MKKTNHFYRFCALALSCLLLVSLFPVMQAFADGDGAIHIKSAEDLRSLAHSCTLDSWSRGKTVVLDNNIVLESDDALPIPTFGGTFDGGGHTISGLVIEDSVSPAGLFGVLQSSGVVKNLRVEGAVTPSGDGEDLGGIVGQNYGTIESCTFNGSVSGERNIGGIAGENAASGVIRSCEAAGAIFGQNMTGGLVGSNLGTITSSKNRAYVNVESSDPAINLDDLSFEFSLDLSKLSRLDTISVATDTGGVAGYSSGVISGCVNAAAVGYQHVGYNVGGIVGRSSGQIVSCTNEGAVCGRKDVGGIAGQMEPYIRMEISEGLLQRLKTQLGELGGLVNTAASHAEGGSSEISSRLNSMSGYVDSAVNELDNVRLNASIDSNISGGGSHSSDTSIGAGSGAAAGVDHEHSGSGHSTTIWGGSGAGAGASHEGGASGSITGSTQIVAAPDLGGLTSSINGLSSQVTMLNSAANGTVGTLANDIRAISNKFNELSNTVLSAMSDSGVSVISDTSSVDIDAVTLGKVSLSKNNAAVYGDVNTGGIAGSMALEYSLDPEDDVTEHLSSLYRKQYEYKSIVQKCVNTGAISGKRSYVGGIVGRMDLGYVTGCEGYGSAESENGSYVGGIAGVTGGVVHGSYAKCTLSGKKYVGGIVGSGVQESVDGGKSSVNWNYSLVEINDCQQYVGAVSGSDTGAFANNYYVSDDLPGINRQGFAARAEPIPYEQLYALDDLPDGMKSFTLTFIADGEEVLRRTFDYGASFGADDIPDVPDKDGCHGRWDRTDLTNLHFDTVVTAEYEAFTPGLASEQTREGGLSVILVEGEYNDGDEIKVTAEPLTPEAFGVQSGTLFDRVRGYFSCLGRGELPPLTANREVLEQWSIELADDGQEEHTVRYLPPDGYSSPRIYVRQGGAWHTVDTGTMGSYLTFPVAGTSVEIAAVSTLAVGGIWLGAFAVLILLIVLIIVLIKRSKRRARRRAAQASAAVEQAEQILRGREKRAKAAAAVTAAAMTEKAPAPAEDTAQNEAPSVEDILAEPSAEEERPAPADDSIEARLARAEEELRLLREEREARKNALTQPAVKPVKRRGRKRRWIPALITVLALLAAAAVFFLKSDVKKDLEAYHLIEARMKEEPLAMDVTADASCGTLDAQVSAAVTRTKADDTSVTCIERGGAVLYYANGVIYLENGRAYPVLDAYPDYSALLDETAALCRSLTISKSVDGQEKIYTLTADGEDAASLLRILASDEIADAAAINALRVDLVAESGELMELRFSAEGAGDLKLDAAVLFRGTSAAPEIPDAVREAMKSGTDEVSGMLTDDTLRLMQALAALREQQELSADIALSADCGPVVVSDTLQYDRRSYDGQDIACIRKNTLEFYFSNGRICTADGESVDSAELVDSAQLVDLTYELLLNGTASCTHVTDGYAYTLTLDQDGMSSLAAAIAPSISEQDVSFASGYIEARVSEDGTLEAVSVSCSGALHLILTDAPAAVSATLTPAAREFSFSQQALTALKQ